MTPPLVSPLPPIAGEELPHIGAGLRFLEAPTDYLKELRARHGDTFALDIFGFNLLLSFSPKGLESLYKLEEETASFGQATFDLIGFKTPTEIFADASPTLFYELLLHQHMPGYVATIDAIVERELARWGDGGELDIFDAVRTLEQRVGYGLWIAPEAAEDRHWPELKRCFDVLDQESAFVDPTQALATIKSGKARERAAVEEIKRRIAAIADEHDRSPEPGRATLDLLREKFGADATTERDRKVAHNIINANQGFLSNLYAAIAWVVVQLARHTDIRARVETEIAAVRGRFGADFTTTIDALNAMEYLEQVMMESVRLAQRSLTLRKVLAPVEFDDGATVYTVQPGVYIATLLSVTNTQTPELARFDPDHYQRNQLAKALVATGKETVSTFGHGRHACPAQRFSHHMCKIVIARLLERFELRPLAVEPSPSVRQLGGVARPEQPARLTLVRR